MMYVRGNKLDYDLWEAQGNPGWNYSNVLRYFKKSENATLLTPRDVDYHGENGPIHVEYVNKLTDLTKAYLNANNELGVKNVDYNGKDQIGYSLVQSTIIHGKRNSGAKGFLTPILSRKNLVIRRGAYVVKLLTFGKSIIGVKYMLNSQTYCSYRLREVILSAGAINSPHLLMLSGIGPKKHLSQFGIPVIKNLPVGEGLWDHISVTNQPFITNLTLQPKSQADLVTAFLNGTGPYTCPDAVQGIAFTNTNLNTSPRPDVEQIFRASTVPPLPFEFYKKTKNIVKELFDAAIAPTIGKVAWFAYTMLLHPKSRGTIRLQSSSPFDFPLVDPAYFTDANNTDLKTLIASLKDVLKLLNTTAMQQYNSTVFPVNISMCSNYTYGSDDYYGCFIKFVASTLHHFSGTCKMGPKYDKTSVVGSNFKVHDVVGLRVVDASVIPVTLSGHPNAVCYMLGEKAADMIKSDWLL